MALLSLSQPEQLLAQREDGTVKELQEIYLAAIKSPSAVERGLKLTEVALMERKDSALFKAYHGAFLALKARDSFWPLRKWNFAQDGLKELDQAVASENRDLEVRLLRATITHNLPLFFNRKEEAGQDLKWIIETLDTNKYQGLRRPVKMFLLNFLLTTNLSLAEERRVKELRTEISNAETG